MNYFLNRAEMLDVDELGEEVSRGTVGDGMTNFSALAIHGEYGDGDGQLYSPSSAAIIDDYVFIADAGNNRIAKWRLQGGVFVSSEDHAATKLLSLGVNLYTLDTSGNVGKCNPDTLFSYPITVQIVGAVDMCASSDVLFVSTASSIHALSPNTLQEYYTLSLSGVSDDYISITTDGLFLYVLADTTIYKLSLATGAVETSYEITEIVVPQRIRFHDNYIFVIGDSKNFLVLDDTLNVVLDQDYDNLNWYSSFDIVTYKPHVFVSVDSTANRIELMYGYDPRSGVESGDDVSFDDLQFGDSVPTVGFVRLDPAHSTRRKWRKT